MNYISIWRRLASILYDFLLVVAVLIIMSIPFFSFDLQENNLLKVTIQIYYYLITQYFFVWFWVHNQGTLGMKTWKIKIICDNNNRLSYKQAIIRFNVAIFSLLFFGLGFLISFFRKDKKCFHDIISKTALIKL
ncbi:MAG: RDD family protein [Gammaproteobacteria bacterium]|nr:RDD family protein [Gammaproteobacteria bacterium]|tara:strand:+ start:5759 stop:6160 length:402 start_codon:yes stop_codon:yes gene_type:complete